MVSETLEEALVTVGRVGLFRRHGRGRRVPVAHAHRRPLPRGAQLEEARAAHRRARTAPRQHAADHGW